jgi:hypothetical protein
VDCELLCLSRPERHIVQRKLSCGFAFHVVGSKMEGPGG